MMSSSSLFRFVFTILVTIANNPGGRTLVFSQDTASYGGDKMPVASIFTWSDVGTILPKAVSDLTASRWEQKVYLTGGCDAVDGNVFDINQGLFFCSSVSSSLWEFDLDTKSIQTLTDMPRARYRHAAVAMDGKIWLFGGRDTSDELISFVDVYDIASQTWYSFEDLPERFLTSDNTAFGRAATGQAFVMGGYNQTYAFHDFMIAIDTNTSWADKKLTIEVYPNLLAPRGDLSSAVDEQEEYAVVSGGFGPKDSFCEPLNTVELFNFTTSEWTSIAPLNRSRSDLALVEMNDFIFAIGGERQIKGICEIDVPDPGEQTIPVDDFEVFSVESGKWQFLQDIPVHRFRFAAVAVDEELTVYTFGGQQEFSRDCLCFRTTNEISAYAEGTAQTAGTVAYTYWTSAVLVLLTCLYLGLR